MKFRYSKKNTEKVSSKLPPNFAIQTRPTMQLTLVDTYYLNWINFLIYQVDILVIHISYSKYAHYL